MLSLSVVLPAYNEEENVESAVEQVSAAAQQLGMDYEIILVNDGSADRTGEIARELMQRIPNFRLVEHYPNRGYGGSLKAGFAAAAKDLITFVPDRPGHDRRYAIDAAKIRREMGWQPRVDFAGGLETTIAWYREHRDWWEKIRSGAYRDYYDRMYGAGGRHE